MCCHFRGFVGRVGKALLEEWNATLLMFDLVDSSNIHELAGLKRPPNFV